MNVCSFKFRDMTFAAREAVEADSDWAVWVSVHSWSSSLEPASSRHVAIRSVCNEFWSLGRRETKFSASVSRDSSSHMRWESSARLASRTRILARSSWSSWSSGVVWGTVIELGAGLVEMMFAWQ
jgi:hypothetical protein